MSRPHSAQYTEYMQSDQWRARCYRLRKKRGNRCERCGSGLRTEVHHLNYDHLGHERDEDLQIVCKQCHPAADRERIEWEERRRQQNGVKWVTLE